jgi:hypothetical protein
MSADAPIFVRNVDGHGLSIQMADGSEIDLENGGLMNRWLFGGDLLSMSEIANRLMVPPTLPSPQSFVGAATNPMPSEGTGRLKSLPVPFRIPSWH